MQDVKIKWKIRRDDKARKILGDISLFMDGHTKESPTNRPIKGFFREDSYDWTAYIFTKDDKASEYVLIIKEHLQHEGYCKKYLKL